MYVLIVFTKGRADLGVAVVVLVCHSNGSFTLVRIPQWTVAFLQRDRKFYISALKQSTEEFADHRGECEQALTLVTG